MNVQPVFGARYTLQVKPSKAPHTDFKLLLPNTLSVESRNQIRYDIQGNIGAARTITYNTDYVSNQDEKKLIEGRIEQTIQANLAQIDEYTVRPHTEQ